MQIDVLDIF